MSNKMYSILTLFVAIALAIGALGLAGCGNSSSSEQDNCYGEDMPVVNN